MMDTSEGTLGADSDDSCTDVGEPLLKFGGL